MKSVSVSLRLPADLIEEIDRVCDNRSRFLIEAAREKLLPPAAPAVPDSPSVPCAPSISSESSGMEDVRDVPELTDKEKRDVLKGAKGLNEMLQEAMLLRLRQDKNFLSKLNPVEFARLVAGRLPKDEQTDKELEAEVLGLEEVLAMLPAIDDITAELTKAKGELFKTVRERDLLKKLLDHSRDKATLEELMALLYKSCVEYVRDLIARNNLPGFGDGGGLSQKGYAEIASEVKRRLDQLEVYRK